MKTGTASSQPRRGISAPCPDSCIALLVIIFDARPPEPPELLPELGPISRRHSRFIYTSQSGREKANRASKPQAWPEDARCKGTDAIYPHSGAFLGSEHLRALRFTLRSSRDRPAAVRALSSSLLLPCRWFQPPISPPPTGLWGGTLSAASRLPPGW
ncbi:uncharacterized protein LOC130679022 [Manis pentadactyla]|uniref:uncharacterized protein LOC130679022 n=1 Tax=Manis pentadactyla TaxID=143292 RepID=UPI00255C4294|nr:uncharacterized protein LOC130679022 [Manis pentadactyla]